MLDRDKIIKALECCGHTEFMQYCDDCPYDGPKCFTHLKSEVLTLLKAQEPRVMTLYEVAEMAADFHDYCMLWFEPKEVDAGMWFMAYAQPVVGDETDIHIYEFGNEVPIEAKKYLYGKTWRCWTSRPTDAQRENTPWQ